MIQRGYDRRHRVSWNQIRWQTYNLMCAFAGSKALKEAGINGPIDLQHFPWDKPSAPPISEDEKNELQAEIAAMNAQ